MRTRAFLAVLAGAALAAISGLAALSGLAAAAPLNETGTCRAYSLIDEVTGKVITGPEDIAIHEAGGMVYVSAYDRRRVARERAAGGPIVTEGGIYRFALPDRLPDGEVIAVSDMTRDFRKTGGFRPHGFHLGTGDNPFLHVVNRAYEMVAGKPVINPAIERFRLDGGSLVHQATMRPGPGEPAMCSPNDLWARADGTFYVSNDHGNCTGFGRGWEEIFALSGSYLLYYDGQGFRKVVENLVFANGVAGWQNPASGETLIIVSETRAKRLRVYDQRDLLSGGKARPRYSIKLDGSPDNLSWSGDGEQTGDLLVATIPNIIAMGAYMRGLFGKKKTASRAQRIPWDANGPGRPETVFEDGGSMISGATVMAGAGGLYFIGAAFDDNIAICTADPLAGPAE